jgi:hypothetical protein
MNERILSPQLLKLVQAAGPGYSLADPEWVKKFAELIVRDMMNLFGDEILSLHYLEQGCCQDSVTLLRSKIKEHFGVEE